jgi:serine/threonine-protein kinase
MTSERWQQIETLLDEVLARSPEERTAFLNEACAGDHDLRREIDALLAAEDAVPTFLEADAAAFVAPALDDLIATTVAGRQVGPYRLVRELGHGGMGVVYLAEREDVGRQVALKLVRGELANPGATERFLFEQRVLARLEHPHIARLYDVGVTADHTPYFAMEYVEGQALNAYCDAHHLGIEARLRLFVTVGQAVQHAHQHFIVHRDLKPSNILVTEDEAGQPQVKLLDFGVAKVLADAEEGVPAQTLTAAGRRLMTPAYAAPEQIKGEAITAPTDVYSLGVVLYELLTGQRPYEVTGPETAQAVLTQDPQRPSTAVSEGRTGTTTETAAARATTVEDLRRRLQGDLDVICLKALQKEPGHRYASAEAFVEDIKRHLAGLPVQAREATMGYRARKFVRRHRVGVAMAAVFVVLIVGFAVAMTVQQQVTAQQRDRAQVEAQKASAVTDFMLGLFEANEPGTTPTDTITARTLLARGIERAAEMESQPEVQAEMLMTIGRAYRVLGQYDQAEPLLRKALAIQRAHLGDTHTAVAASLEQLGQVLHEQGDYAAADSFHHAALALRRNLFGERHPDVASSLNERGFAHWYQGNFEVADSLNRLALDLALDLLGDEDPRTITMMSDLANIRGEMGDYPAAESLQRDVLALRQRVLGERHVSVADDFSHLGTLMTRQGDYEAADSFYHAALVLYRELLGETHSNVATVVSNLAVVKGYEGDYEAAEQFMREALVLQRRILGDRHPFVATAMDNLGALLALKGEYDTALALHHQGLALRRDLLGAEHPSLATSLSNVANALSYLDRHADAEPLYREALAIKRDALGAEHPEVAKIMYNLAAALHKQRNFAEAESLHREVLRMRRQLFEEQHPSIAQSLNALARLQQEQGSYREAEALFQEALSIRQARLGVAHAQTQETLADLVALYEARNQPEKAAPHRAMLSSEKNE